MDRVNEISFRLHTWGCKVNTYDTGLLEKRFEKAGWKQESKASVHVLNTCAVTAEATKEAVRRVRRLKAQDPFCRVVVTGCAAQVDTDQFSNIPGVDLVVANSHKGRIEELVEKMYAGTLEGRIFKSNIFRKDDLEEGGGVESGHSRSFLKIQDGCNSFCTYCVIPFARGKSRSISIDEIVARVNELTKADVQEVVITGVHIADYEDGERRLGDLIEALLVRTTMPRFRLSSIEPVELSERLLKSYENPRMCRSFHMSIQSATTKVLADMRRKYTAEDVEMSLKRIQEFVPGAYVGMDVIVGFPGETDEEFQETYDRLANLPWTKIHVFPYSVRPGTRAEKSDNQWPQSLIKARAKKLRMLSDERLCRMAEQQIGTIKRVLPLKNTETFESLSRDYWPVHLTRELPLNQEIEVRVVGAEFHRLKGVPVHDSLSVS